MQPLQDLQANVLPSFVMGREHIVLSLTAYMEQGVADRPAVLWDGGAGRSWLFQPLADFKTGAHFWRVVVMASHGLYPVTYPQIL